MKQDQPYFIPTYDAVRRIVTNADPPSEEFKREVVEAMNRFLILANDNRWNSALRTDSRMKFAPVEFIHIGYMIWKFPSADYYELAAWVNILRTEVRQKQPGQVRLNKPCTTILKDRIETFTPATPGPRNSRKRTRPAPEDDQDYYPEMDLGGTRSRPNAGRGRQRLSVSGSYASTESPGVSHNGQASTSGPSATPTDSGRLFRMSTSPEATASSSGSARASASQQPANPPQEQPYFTSTWDAANNANGSASASGSGSGGGATNFLPNVGYMG